MNKKTTFFASTVLATALITGCGISSSANSDTVIDSISQATTAPTSADDDNNIRIPEGGWQITGEGVGPVVLGADLSSLPQKVDGLYDSLQHDDNMAYATLKDNDVMTIYTDNGKIIGIQVFGDNVRLKAGGKTFKAGDDSDMLKSMPGVKGESYNDNGEYNGVSFEGHDGEIQFFQVGNL